MLSRRMSWVLLLPLSACAFISDDHEAWRLDPDKDGVDLATDCDNTDASVGAPLLWHLDLDGDGFGDPNNTVEACERPENAVSNSLDCWDDADNIPADFVALNGLPQPDPADVYPDATNALYDGINQSCAEDFALEDEFDGDGDGYLSAHHADRDGVYGDDCIDGSDVDDPNGAGLDPDDVNPGAAEVWYDGTDADCDGNDCDQDGDGYDGGEGSDACTPVDCNDIDASIRPDSSVSEIFYNGVDDNCDISVGDQDGDQDGDGFWSASYDDLVTQKGGVPLEVPKGSAGDCWDDPLNLDTEYTTINGFLQPSAADVNPGAVEVWWDGVDGDCVGDDDFDADGDGYAYDGYPNRDGVAGDDCYDAVDQPDAFENLAGLAPALVNIAAVENYYDGTDANCDGNDDDQDMDGHAADVTGGDDCDDTDASVNPSASEQIGDGIDGDCDGTELCYTDVDGDGYSVNTILYSSDADCDDANEGLASGDEDCDDANGSVYPEAEVVCEDGIEDNDCDGVADDCLLDASLSELLSLTGGNALGTAMASLQDGGVLVGVPEENTVYVVHGPVTVSDELDSPSVAEVYAITDNGGDGTGWSVDGNGDVDGDGQADVVIGIVEKSETSNWNSSGAWLVYGGISADISLSSSSSAVQFSPERGSDGAGAAVTISSDMDGDGYAELVVGAPNAETDEELTDAGMVYLLYGGVSFASDLLSDADAWFYGDEEDDAIGESVVGGVDLNGDGYGDLGIGAPGISVYASEDGCAAWIYGQSDRYTGGVSLADADARFCGDEAEDAMGGALASGGDLDGDGYDELLISGPAASSDGGSTGLVYVIYGQLSAFSTTHNVGDVAQAILVGEREGDQFGQGLGDVGDINGDGLGDLWVGAGLAQSGNGSAYLFYGPFSGQHDASDADAIMYGSGGAELGASVAGGVDLTGDSWPDLLVGAPGTDRGDGAILVIEGTGY